ncbi:MAG: hypothetical protein ACNA8L_07670 [Luteolibacter sp.]
MHSRGGVGNDGAGKTGLCIALLEEAAMDNIPSIIIDPKGDIANLLLTFPELDAASFRPWIHEDEALRKSTTPDVLAGKTADLWKSGLAQWGQTPERVASYREKVDVNIFTPGSRAGIPVSILSSLDAPPFEVMDDAELAGERIESTVTSLLSLVGVHGDVIQSPEAVLLTNIFHHAWSAGQDISLESLIRHIQRPAFDKVGVIDLEAFLPERSRQALALRFNNLLASPGFATWLDGPPLDIASMLHAPDGKPRCSIFSIAHLDYKALSNIGNWFLGRLQTERDKARVLDGLEGAAASQGGGFDRREMDCLLSGLGNRIFLMNNVHEDGPVLFHVRWVMSYLAGPLTRGQIKTLMDPKRTAFEKTAPAESAADNPMVMPAGIQGNPAPRPAVGSGVAEVFLAATGGGGGIVYQPHLLREGVVHFVSAKASVDESRNVRLANPITATAIDWECEVKLPEQWVESSAAEGAVFGELPGFAMNAANYKPVEKEFSEWLYRNERFDLWFCPALKAWSMPGEAEGDFRARLLHQAHEVRDAEVEKIRTSAARKLRALESRLQTAEGTLVNRKVSAQDAKMKAGVSIVGGILGALMGRKSGLGTLSRNEPLDYRHKPQPNRCDQRRPSRFHSGRDCRCGAGNGTGP